MNPDQHEHPTLLARIKTCSVIVFLIVFLAGAGMVAHDRWRCNSLRSRAAEIRIGDSKEQVEKLLGNPNTIFPPSERQPTSIGEALLHRSSEEWAYGTTFEFSDCFFSEFPFFYPFRFRLFGPDADDVGVEFDSSGKVSDVSIPEAAR
jgi:hypothetical protein